ncbi:DUF416 family protein [Luteibacter sp. 3190]|uniref:DUF416 family protein n=1 Tax=Luteibacter sp. 3190 TaxID=2817736 RepID=UPI00285A8095|nr:DUF416 family protein [Luteibacter sp. 3190]MDR6935692.1 uncharacterized protein YjaG (DUF416 family) [Luteibacter sp. 3190]
MGYDIQEIEVRLKQMNAEKQLAFGLSLAERALPMYLAFQAETAHLGTAQVFAAYASLWRAMETGQWRDARFVEASDCERVMPDSEDFDSFYTSAAMDVVAMFCGLLDFINHRDAASIIEATTLQFDTIDLATQRLIGEYGVNERDPMVFGPTSMLSQERSRMQADLDFLEANQASAAELAIDLRSRIWMLDYRNTRLIRLPSLSTRSKM